MRLVGCLPGGHRSFLPLLSTSGGRAILEEGFGGWWHVSWCTAGPPAWKPSCSLPPEGQALIRALLLGPARWLQAELGSEDS